MTIISPTTTPILFSATLFELKLIPVGASAVLLTVILKVSVMAARPLSVAVTITSIAPTSPFKGVPLKVLEAALNDNQDGSVLPSERVAV